jgi:hypothetical protein
MRKLEIFTAGCPVCAEQVSKVVMAASPNWDIEILNVKENQEALKKSRAYGINKLPSVVMDGTLAKCCEHNGIDIDVLKSLGLDKD